MYARSESGDGIARNLASHSRWALADSAVKPRSSPVGEGARARSRIPRPQAAIGRVLTRIRTEPRGRVGGQLLVSRLGPGLPPTRAYTRGDLWGFAVVGQGTGAKHARLGHGAGGEGP